MGWRGILTLIAMRIVYDYVGPTSRTSIKPIAPIGRTGETAIVIRIGRVGSETRFADDLPGVIKGAAGGGVSKTGQYKTSDEALARDRAVRGHENAHLSALGPYAASGILYDTAKGASGETIATGGRIAVDLAEVPGDPAATLRKARIVLNAAQAPGDPSAADLRVAARAYRLMQQAQAEISLDLYA